jgi:ribosomal 50S subunit-recycling heat shock protein
MNDMHATYKYWRCLLSYANPTIQVQILQIQYSTNKASKERTYFMDKLHSIQAKEQKMNRFK